MIRSCFIVPHLLMISLEKEAKISKLQPTSYGEDVEKVVSEVGLLISKMPIEDGLQFDLPSFLLKNEKKMEKTEMDILIPLV